MRWSYESGRLWSKSSRHFFSSILSSIVDSWENRVFKVLMCLVIKVDSSIQRVWIFFFLRGFCFATTWLHIGLSTYPKFLLSTIILRCLIVYYLLLLNVSLKWHLYLFAPTFYLQYFFTFHQLLLSNFPSSRWLIFIFHSPKLLPLNFSILNFTTICSTFTMNNNPW